MKFRSILSLSPDMRTNSSIFCLIFAVFCSLQSLISGVKIVPGDKTKAIWNTQTLFATCEKTKKEVAGTLKWIGPKGQIDDNNRAPVYVQESRETLKLFLMNSPKKNSGTYECRHTLDGKVISSDKFELKIYDSIKFKGEKDSFVGTEGHTFSMPCLAEFDAEATEASVSWSHNNHPIKDREGQFTVTNVVTQSVDRKNVKSILNIKPLSKENEGLYVCEAVYANPYLTDIKTTDFNLRVQYKPRFPENTQKNVWISDTSPEGPIVVNVTCLVNADPVAQFTWFTGHGVPVEASNLGPKGVRHTIHSTENLSVLSLEYNDLNQIRNNFKEPDGMHRKFECRASNVIGSSKLVFELNIGKLPDPPVLDKYDYKNGILVLSVNESEVEPPIDIYRLDIDVGHQIYFNASNRNPKTNNTYEIMVDVPYGTHQVIIYAHNPVGWSSDTNNPNPPLQLVINSALSTKVWTLLLMASVLGTVIAF